ncbi:MAG: hypothetical protein OEW19_03660 [Acidobacteriota bacterium]|nr:hypothetical protein [Acidobacteriota bacterium]
MLRALVAGAAVAMAAWGVGSTQTATSVRSVLVSVSDAGGLPVVGLLPDDFVIDASGIPVDALTATPSTHPLVLLVDTGAAAREYVTTFRAPLVRFVERTALSPLSLVTFGDIPVVAVKFTPDGRRVTKGLNGLFARPETASYLQDGLYRVAQEVRRLEVPLADAVVVTAPSFDASRRDTDRLIRDLIESHVRVHVVAQRTRVSANMPTPPPKSMRTVSAADALVYTSREQIATLTDISAATGGTIQQVDLQSGLADALRQIHEQHLGEYIVEFRPPSADVSAESFRFKVNLPGVRMSVRSLSR